MNSEGTRLRANLVPRILNFALDYICYIPITYVVLYSFAMVVVLVAGTSAEAVFIKTLLFALGIKGGDATLNGQDIVRGFFFWWLIIGTIFQLFKRVFNLNFSKGILLVLFLLIVAGTISLAVKTGSVFVPLFLLILFVVNVLIYFVLNWVSDKIRLILRKI